MGTFVGLDVSLKETSVCILDQDGTRVFEGKVASEPAAIARLIRKQAPDLARVGLESGPTSVWLTHSLKAEGLPVVCLDARHAQAVLSVRPNKTDRGDARGLAEMVRVGWFKAVQVKSLASHEHCIGSGLTAPISGGRRRRRQSDRSSTTELRASGDAVLAGTAGRDDRASCVVRRYDDRRAVRIFTLRRHCPLKPMMRRSGIDLGENHDLGRPATSG